MFSGKRILLVEDEALVAMLLEDMVLSLGAVVIGPESQLDIAIHIAETDVLDAAILDINLGGRRSYGVADALRLRGIPFAFATGYGEHGVDPAHRGVPVLMKPYTEDDVARALDLLLLAGNRRPAPAGAGAASIPGRSS
jgi:CheY-like chemotaxis protein